MERHLIEKKPTWWLLYTNGAALVGLVWLLEVSVASEAARLMLEIGAVAAMFVLMLCWLRVNRGRIELAETRVTRRDAVELPAHDGSRAAPPRVPPRMWLDRPARGGRRVS
jgi:hypothetical protein